ncbi:EutP/PduV family microcompartment system protein [Halodesulfovibrio aestuarii]|uniref:EutP/PduV family microcompartment system protein n=1 Tax=Halodesulfovibrio aestuarii TaxID=126333 RepID=UPI003D337990
MSSKRVMFIGATGCGKSALAQALEGQVRSGRSAQEVVYGKKTIDVPSEYLEHPWMFQSLIAIAQNNASHVVFVVGQGNTASAGSPGLGNVFTCPVVGVVTTDCNSLEGTERCFGELARLGVPEPYFVVNPNEQVDRSLAEYLFDVEQSEELR